MSGGAAKGAKVLSSIARSVLASSWEIPGEAELLLVVANASDDPIGAFSANEEVSFGPHNLLGRVAVSGVVVVGATCVTERRPFFLVPPKALRGRRLFGRGFGVARARSRRIRGGGGGGCFRGGS